MYVYDVSIKKLPCLAKVALLVAIHIEFVRPPCSYFTFCKDMTSTKAAYLIFIQFVFHLDLYA